jgi:hypothetical protein
MGWNFGLKVEDFVSDEAFACPGSVFRFRAKIGDGAAVERVSLGDGAEEVGAGLVPLGDHKGRPDQEPFSGFRAKIGKGAPLGRSFSACFCWGLLRSPQRDPRLTTPGTRKSSKKTISC